MTAARRLAAILAADVVGYSRLADADADEDRAQSRDPRAMTAARLAEEE